MKLTRLVLCLSLPGCGSEGIDLALSVDPNVSTSEELAARLGTLIVILDSDEGLYPAGAEVTDGDLQVKNADADAALEVVQTIPLTEATLPTIRLERGGLSASAVDIRVIGLERDTSTPIADGAARAVSFDTSEPVSVPFNFLDGARPPRVTAVYPGDGMTIQGCDLSGLSVVFSRPMDAESLEGAISIRSPTVAGLSVVLNESRLVGDLAFNEPISGDGAALSIELEVATSALADDGTALDQIGGQPGPQPYEATLRIICGPPPTMPCTPGSCPWSCGSKDCPKLAQVACVDDVCTPASCSVTCSGGTVCYPLADQCVPDCREADALSTCVVGSCSAVSGLCE